MTVGAHAQGTGQVMYGNPNYNRTVVVGSATQVGASNPVPTGMGPLSQPMPPAGRTGAIVPWYNGYAAANPYALIRRFAVSRAALGVL